MHGLNPERVLLASEACGIGEVALDRAITYAKERIVFDRPIGTNQAISHPLAHAHAQLRAAWMMALHAGRRYDAGLECGEAANTAKYLAAEASFYAADRAVANPRRHGLRHRIPRRALLARSPPPTHRARHPGDDPQLPRAEHPRLAPELLTPCRAVVDRGFGRRAQGTDVRGHELLAPVDGPGAGTLVPRLEARVTAVSVSVASPRATSRAFPARTWSSALVAQIVQTS